MHNERIKISDQTLRRAYFLQYTSNNDYGKNDYIFILLTQRID